MIRLLFVPSCSLLLAIAGCVGAPDPIFSAGISTAQTTPDWSFLTLGPSDVLQVTVLGHPELSSTLGGVRIDPQGDIHLPEVGRVAVKGITVAELNLVLREEFGKVLRSPQVTATVLDYQSRSYYVLGHFENPGIKYMDRPTNVMEAAAMGGRILRGADRGNLFLLRPHQDRLEVHRFSLRQPGPRGLVQVRPGDIVYLRPSGSWSFQEQVLPILSGLGVTIPTLIDTPILD